MSLQRRGRLERKTPLQAKTGLQGRRRAVPETTIAAEGVVSMDFEAAAKALRHQLIRVERDHAPVPDPVKAVREKNNAGAFPAATRALIFGRDGHQCVRCGWSITDSWPGVSIQHRIARGMGGSSAAHLILPSNGITLCGSATTGCHGWVEDHPAEAGDAGWAIRGDFDPATVPVLHHTRGWMLLDNTGGAYRPPGSGIRRALDFPGVDRVGASARR